MDAISWPSLLSYCAFSAFIFYQQRHVHQFKGASQGTLLALNLSVLIGRFTGLVYLVYYAWAVAWWAPIVIFAAGILSTGVGVAIEKLVGELSISLFGFAGWPICAYLMFVTMPSST